MTTPDKIRFPNPTAPYAIVLFLICLLVTQGCSKRPKEEGLAEDRTPARPKYNPDATYKGVSALVWGQQVFDADFQTSLDAANALEQLGADGVPYLVEHFTKSRVLRANEARALSMRPESVAYAQELIPILDEMLDNELESAQACKLCARLGKVCSPLLKKLQAVAKSSIGYEAKWATEAVNAIEKP